VGAGRYGTLTGMKSRLLLAFSLTAASYGQQNVSIPIIVAGSQTLLALKTTDLKVEVNHQLVSVTSVTPLSGQHLQYVLMNGFGGRSHWPSGLDQQADVATKFLKEVVVAGSDDGTLVNFGERQVFLDVQNERDPRKLSAKLERHGRSGTPLFDAVVSSARWIAKQPEIPTYRKLIVLFWNAEDTSSKSSMGQAIEALQRAATPIFIFAPSSIDGRKNGEELSRLAAASGGRAYFPPRKMKSVSFDAFKRDLAQSFLVGIDAPSLQGVFLPLKIEEVVESKASVIAASQIALQ
jgi:hypothetical protein